MLDPRTVALGQAALQALPQLMQPGAGLGLPGTAGVTRVHVTLTSALVGPTKADGCQWDGFTCNAGGTAEVVRAVNTAMMSSNPYTAALAVLSGPLSQSVEKPDPEGSAEMFTEGQFDKRSLEKRQDCFTPQWGVRWLNVRLDRAMRLSVRLRDADLQLDDDMGMFDIGYESVVEALRTNSVVQVRVDQQTYRQVLFVGISVLPAG